MQDDLAIKKMVKGFRELIIILFLTQKPMHGYEIKKKFEDLFYVNYPSSVIYPMLRGLEKKGYIKSEWKQAGGRRKRLYSATEEGRAVLKRSREILEKPAREVLMSIIGE